MIQSTEPLSRGQSPTQPYPHGYPIQLPPLCAPNLPQHHRTLWTEWFICPRVLADLARFHNLITGGHNRCEHPTTG